MVNNKPSQIEGCPVSRRGGGACSCFCFISHQLMRHCSSTLMRPSLLSPLIQISVTLEIPSQTHPKLMCDQLSRREPKSTTRYMAYALLTFKNTGHCPHKCIKPSLTITEAVTTLSSCSNCREQTTPPLKSESGPVQISFSCFSYL